MALRNIFSIPKSIVLTTSNGIHHYFLFAMIRNFVPKIFVQTKIVLFEQVHSFYHIPSKHKLKVQAFLLQCRSFWFEHSFTILFFTIRTASSETLLYNLNIVREMFAIILYHSNVKIGFVRSQVNGSTDACSNPLYDAETRLLFLFLKNK